LHFSTLKSICHSLDHWWLISVSGYTQDSNLTNPKPNPNRNSVT